MLRRSLLLTGSLGLTGLAGAAAMGWWIDRQTAGRCYDRVDDVPRRKTAIVLGARVQESGQPSTALEDRLETAQELWQRERVEEVLVSGNAQAPEFDEPRAMRRWLLDRGVPPDRVRCDPAGSRTLHTMRQAADVLDVRSAIVCTQSFHLPRAVFLATRVGIDAVGLRADRHYRTRLANRVRELGAKTAAFIEGYSLPQR